MSGLNTELVRVESSRLPEQWRKVKSISAYRFTSRNYSATVRTGLVEPRLNLQQLWVLKADQESLHLHGRLLYEIERAGVFSVVLSLPSGGKLMILAHQTLSTTSKFR